MLREDIEEKYYMNLHTRKVPALFMCECLKAFEEVLKKEREENPYESVSELFRLSNTGL